MAISSFHAIRFPSRPRRPVHPILQNLRLAQRLLFITVPQYEFASERLTEIGRLASAWQRLNAAKHPQQPAVPGAAPA
jgi:hypothetical protein